MYGSKRYEPISQRRELMLLRNDFQRMIGGRGDCCRTRTRMVAVVIIVISLKNAMLPWNAVSTFIFRRKTERRSYVGSSSRTTFCGRVAFDCLSPRLWQTYADKGEGFNFTCRWLGTPPWQRIRLRLHYHAGLCVFRHSLPRGRQCAHQLPSHRPICQRP